MLVICGDGLGGSKNNFGGVGWQKCLVAANKFWGVQKICESRGDKKFLGSKKIVRDRASKKLCGQKTEKILGIVQKFVGRTGGGKILGIQGAAKNFSVGDSRDGGINNQN